MRLLILLCAAVLCLGAAPALAQEPAPTPDPDATEQLDPEETAVPDDEIVDGEDAYTAPGCEGADGTDGDYTYCGCRDTVGMEGDYLYCAASPTSATAPAVEKRTERRRSEPAAVNASQALPASLPLTGGNPSVVALIGLGFVLVGLGGRLRLGATRPGGRTPSG